MKTVHDTHKKRDLSKLGEGKYVDSWTIPHVLFGALMSALPFLINMNVLLAFFLMLLAAILWEAFESIQDIYEYKNNSLIDVLVAIVAFAIIYPLLLFLDLDSNLLWLVFAIFFSVFILLNFLGWLRYMKRKYNR